MQTLKVSDVQNVSCLGAGPIGAGWAAHFLAQGFRVTSYMHMADEEASLRALIDDAWVSLTAKGLAAGASLENFTCTSDLAAAVADAQFVQESVPESLPLKQALYAKLDNLVAPHVVIGSSTSGLRMTDIQENLATAERTVVGHPFNPPYLLPLVEVVGGEQTAKDTVNWVADFYRAAGKAPLVLEREVPGFVATRLQEAVWREALHMIAAGEATVDDVDFAIINGPGPRWALMGPCLSYHIGGGVGGMEYCLEQFGPALKLPWSRMEAPELTPELARKLIDGSDRLAAGRDYSTLNRQRDAGLVAIQKAVADVFDD
ncbi:MAG: 3-hydroxyacyl-CoA dehydrogenase NAD-binding domain-containing protein [Gammaproteobacteria bacterium]|nr:3-hydroxyacyl-CoA dehydrogenase NAD-binding domain-containing protein [Gammaproteobacteria bacterium]